MNYITFDMPGSGPQTINLTSTLNLTDQMVIDGTSQPGYSGTPLISIQGSSSVPSLFTLGSGSSVSTIQGLDMYSYTAEAIDLTNSTAGNFIQNNWIGFYLNPSSGRIELTNSTFNQAFGIDMLSSYNTIRGNVISGNFDGIYLGEDPSSTWSGTLYHGNSIQSNDIGTNPSGTTASNYGNLDVGVFVGAGGQQNFLGPHNVVSGNPGWGFELVAPSVSGNVIFANKIGTDVTGNLAVANGNGVLLANGAHGNAVGGPFGGNVISGNEYVGVSLGVARLFRPCTIGFNTTSSASMAARTL